MKLQVVRTQFGKDATNGLLFIDGKFECYTLEDQYQAVKVMHETCIPEGEYDIQFRKTGGFHTRYSAKYGNSHYGMLHLQDVQGFTYILKHSGNTDEHTSWYLIVWETKQDLDLGKDGFVGQSVKGYKTMYRKVANELLQGKKVSIEYLTIQQLLKKDLNEASLTDVIVAKDVMEKLQEINGGVIALNAKIKGRVIS